MGTNSRKVALVRSNTVSHRRRVAVVMHHSLPRPEPLWLMIPVEEHGEVVIDGKKYSINSLLAIDDMESYEIDDREDEDEIEVSTYDGEDLI